MSRTLGRYFRYTESMSQSGHTETPTRVAPSELFNTLVFFTWWVRLQQRVEAWSRSSRWTLVGVCALLGVAARLWAQTLPGNWDFGQWINVSTAALDGRDPYELFGYNYPPPWLVTLALIKAVTHSTETFRLGISLLLIVIDLGIALLLLRRGYGLAACLFLLSPVVIAISGQHQQVEGIAVLFALAAMTVLAASQQDRITARDWQMAVLLGVSLSFKPVFLLLPLWLACRPGPWSPRLFRLLAPLGVFGVIFCSSFLVYPPREVIQKVLEYSGANNSPFINAFVPGQLAPWVLDHGGGKLAFLVLLAAAGWLFRRLAPFESALAYSITAVVFSWAVVNQYLAGPMAAVAVFLNVGFLIWLLLASLYLGGNVDVLNLWVLRSIQPHVLLDWQQVMRDLFPWILGGWILFVFASRQPGRLFFPKQLRDQQVIRG